MFLAVCQAQPEPLRLSRGVFLPNLSYFPLLPILLPMTAPMNKKQYEYQAEIKKVPGMDGAYVEFPFDLKKEFGKGRIKVHAYFDGEPYDGSIVNMGVKNADGSICYIIGVRKEIRQKIGKQPGDMISIRIAERDA